MESWTLRPCATYCFSQLNEMHLQLSNAMELEVFRMEPHRILHPGTPSIHDIEVRMLLCCVKYHLRLPINSTTCPRYDLLKFVLHMCGTNEVYENRAKESFQKKEIHCSALRIFG